MKIKFIKKVVFRDQCGGVIKSFDEGDQIEFSYKTENYWITSLGGIYFDEAEEIEE